MAYFNGLNDLAGFADFFGFRQKYKDYHFKGFAFSVKQCLLTEPSQD
jgi:hypothetical protein